MSKKPKDPGVAAALTSVGNKALADGLNITRAAVSQWTRVPAEQVLKVERITGVPRTVLRPDLYPREAAPAHHTVEAAQ
jgi:DNA-binding transcriptional regulator YdaS (Cro superfamily)